MPDVDTERTHITETGALWKSPYFVGLGRAMVSLGPISNVHYCPYQCKFCYVQGPFPKYASATPAEIVGWLTHHRQEYDIVYISGDTDSFASPRTAEALELIRGLSSLHVDVLFTTRYVFNHSELERLKELADSYRSKNLLLIGCISISQLHHPQLEPPPIKDPYQRVELLRELQIRGIVTALTIRPFISTIPASEYCEIARLGATCSDVILGGDLYIDSEGAVQHGLKSAQHDLESHGLNRPFRPLDFSLSVDRWQTLTHPQAETEVRKMCESLNKPFFMRSAPAIDWLRSRRTTFIQSQLHDGSR